MKPYFFLLCVLYLSFLFTSSLVLISAGNVHGLKVLKALADILLPGLCMIGCYGQAFGKTIWSPGRWNAIYTATLILGGFAVMLFGFGDVFGVPSPAGSPPIYALFLIFLPYGLFAGPVIVYEYEMKRGKTGKNDKSVASTK